MGQLLSIGEFSVHCELSVKMLRTYAAAGVLAPAAVDRCSGYRYYSADQLGRARVIGLLRRAAVPVGDGPCGNGRRPAWAARRWGRPSWRWL